MLRRILRRLFCPVGVAGVIIALIGVMLFLTGQVVAGVIAFILALTVILLPRRPRRRRPRRPRR